MRHAIRLLLEQPALALTPDLSEAWRSSKAKGVDLLVQLLDHARANPGITTARLIDRWEDERIRGQLSALATTDLNIPDEGLASEFRDALERLAHQYHKYQRDQLLEQLKHATDDAEKRELIRRISELNAQRPDGKRTG